MDARASWYLAGPALGLIIVGMLWVTNRPLGALGGYIDLYDWLRRPSETASWRVFFLVGVVGGGLMHSLFAGPIQPTFAYGGFAGSFGAAEGVILVAAGLLMGYGARTAGGCTSGHGMCGTALASPGSYVATMTFMSAAIVGANLLSFMLGGAR